MKYPYHKFLTAALAAVLLLSGCGEEKPITPPGPGPAERVLLMYDNIGSWFDDDVDEAGEAVAAGALDNDERVIVYERMSSGNVVYELVRDDKVSMGFNKKELKKYAQGENSSLDRETIARVVGDIRTAIPADHYGLAFGSHGMGWVPASSTVQISRRGGSSTTASEHPFAELWAERENPLTRYFASDTRQRLDVAEFADALDEWEWDFILLDDCFMASVEALYEMRTLADYIIASPTEIMSNGFPYDRVVNTIFDDWSETGFKEVGREFVEAYRSGEMGATRSATVAVVKMTVFDALAESVRRLNLNLNELTSVDGIQYYEGMIRPGHVFFDLDDYLGTIRKNIVPTEYNAFKAQLERTVIFADHTDRFYSDFGLNQSHPVTHYSGLNVFIPWSQTASLIPYYQQTEWHKAVYAQQ
jgi:hypothetical protein